MIKARRLIVKGAIQENIAKGLISKPKKEGWYMVVTFPSSTALGGGHSGGAEHLE